ncbi:MAG TPA: hypothetical protein VNJ08_13875 [Bacteriovoracaceae bacterium]|nr:hypothetical protein [Bacteriovoracaceae bacterium]
MLGRQKTSRKGLSLPTEWLESLSRLLNQTYLKECKDHDRYFDVYGQIFAEEMLLIVSYLGDKDPSVAPIALFLSCGPEQMASVDKIKETQSDYIELAGLFFDEVLSSEDWNEFEPNWQEVTHNNQNYFYKLTRENINLTIEANRLLGDDFEDIEFDSDAE